ncbi:hypothetical protein IJG04_03130 [Candidatus Saccharibacteria bacterium]|nr:hypothetical protein [Candidatus Saccharibacteria bacterium]
MDGKEYLDQISAEVRPNKPQSKISRVFSSIYFKLGIGALFAFIVIVIIGGIISGGKTSLKDQTTILKLHLDRTMEVIKEYQPLVKSSDLRSNSASLYSILSNTNNDLTDFITAKYSFSEKSVSKNITEEADLEKDDLLSSLFEAKINGNLDRIYAHKMAYEISWIATKETSIIKATTDQDLKDILNTSYTSLDNLYSKFDEFSEAR